MFVADNELPSHFPMLFRRVQESLSAEVREKCAATTTERVVELMLFDVLYFPYLKDPNPAITLAWYITLHTHLYTEKPLYISQ